MALTVHNILLIIALVLFLIAAFNAVNTPRVNLMALGLAFVTAALLF